MKKILRHPHFRIILTEWVAFLEAKTENAKSFAIWFLGVMAEAEARKNRPRLREQCAEFALAIQGCPWDRVKAALPPQLSRHRAFLGPKADRFYKAFRQRVTRHVRDYVNELQKAILQGNRESLAHPAVDPILRRFPGLSQEKKVKTRVVKMPEGEQEFDHALIVAGISKALKEWAKDPAHACLGCSRIGFIPYSVRHDSTTGWNVEATGLMVTDGWIRIEEHFHEPKGRSTAHRLLCPKCRAEKGL